MHAGHGRRSAGTALGTSIVAVLARPRWWAMALAGFLLRGGILVLLVLIIPVPTTAGLANSLGPALVGFVFGGPSASFIVFLVALAAAVLGWLILGGLVGVWLDLALIREVAPGARIVDGDPRRALFVRLLAHLPTAIVIAWGAARLVDQAYQELIRPGDPTLPVVLRVVLRVPEVAGLLVAAWSLGEAVGGLAVRHLAAGAGIPRAIGRAVIALVRPAGLTVFVLTTVAVLAALALGGGATMTAYANLRAVHQDGLGGAVLLVALLQFSIAWLGSLALIGLAVAWRSTAWTLEVARRLPSGIIGPARH